MAAETAERRVIRLRENETLYGVDIPPRQAAALRAIYREEQLRVTPSWSGGYDLSAGGHVGTISLHGSAHDLTGPSLDILIEPKVPIANLFHMLTYAHKLADFGRDLSPLTTGDDIFDAVVDIFVRQVDDIARRGIHRGYIDREESAAYLRGRLQVARQVRRGPAVVAFEQETNEFTADLLENRILRAALGLLARARFRDPLLGPRVRRALAAYEEATPIGITAADCDRVVYTRLTERYRSPINLARLFLRHLSLEGREGETPFVSFLVPMPRLFEQFVARLLADAVATRPRLRLEDQWRIWLDEERRLEGRPDLVLKLDGRALLVLDTKYKVYGDKPTNADINQMVTYCHTLGVSAGVLLYPGDDGGGGAYVMKAGVHLRTRPLSLAGSLGEFRARWARWAHELVEPAESVVAKEDYR
jgi:5-methylcytosine-specific restriction enzyme subunit McrC